jgi:hypothetical protein
MKHKQMSFVSNGGKLKLYTVPDGLLFSTPTQLRFSFERLEAPRSVQFRMTYRFIKFLNAAKFLVTYIIFNN